ncbi:MAG TPA: sigma-70 family RNA polymerase sigma factor [Myxococcales bacterium]|jgi:RNA polymerase sigma-70 factor (ECF subfamily)
MLPVITSGTHALAQSGELAANDPAEVYRAWAPTVGRWAHQLGGPGADTEDVVHEVFLKVYQHLPRFRGESQLSTWLFRITANEVAHRRRRARLRRWIFGGQERHPQALEVASREASPLEALQRDQEIGALYRALDRLRERDRAVLILFEIEGLRGEEIAQLMGARVGTVWTWLHRARAKLLVQLEKGAR